MASTRALTRRTGAALATLAASATPALAHHPLGGETPATMVDGLLSGIGHPIIGLDHLAFVAAVGIAGALLGRSYLLPVLFVLATVAGTLVHLAAIGLPAVEIVIAASVFAVGAMLLSGRDIGLIPFVAVFAVAGLFHGHAYGEAVFGAEATPVIAYLIGFGATQFAIATAVGAVVVQASRPASPLHARLAGAMVAGAGVLIVSEHALAAIGLA